MASSLLASEGCASLGNNEKLLCLCVAVVYCEPTTSLGFSFCTGDNFYSLVPYVTC
jgi:hypothetical protein